MPTLFIFILILILCSMYFVFLSAVPIAQLIYHEYNRDVYLVLLDACLYLFTAMTLMYYALCKIL